MNGNKYQEETDLAALPGVLGLELKRYYNSQSSHPGLLGANWRMSYETVLYDFGGEIQILQADGRRLMFQRGLGANAQLCSSPQPQDGQVRIEAAKDGRGAATYHWRWADGRTLSFSGGSGGGFPLQAITAATGEGVTLSYAPSGELNSIRDPQGRKLVFIYAGAAEAQKRSRPLKAIDTPLGRLSYSQDSLGRLTEVAQARDAQSAPFVTRLYHYEDRYNAGYKPGLTGISVRGPDPQTRQIVEQRLSTYAYNAAGQAILSTKGRPKESKDGKQIADTGIEQVELQYVDKPLPQEGKADRKSGEATLAASRLGKTLLTNSLGQKTEITSAVIGGHFRLIEMRGPGCSTCGPSDMRYAYDNTGLLMKSIKLDQQGKTVGAEIKEFDKYGRTVRVGMQSFADGKARATRWTERYEYADVTYPDGSVAIAPVSRPSLVARPSVIAGKEHTVAMSYNALGQVTKVTESGFSPVDEAGTPSPTGQQISRSTAYSYKTIDGKSVLVEIDGPLGNGPLGSPVDSDIIHVGWDATGGRVTSFTYPMGLSASAEFDERTGALSKINGPGGATDTYRYGPWGELLNISRSRAGQSVAALTYRYDLLGRRVETVDSLESRDVPTTAQGYDVASRLLWQADRIGILRRATYDTEGHLLRSQVLTGSIQQEERYRYDAQGRLDHIEDNTGAVRELRRNVAGRITATVDPLGRITEYAGMGDGRGLQVVQAANTAKPLAVRYGVDPAGGVDEVNASAHDGVGGKRNVVTRLLRDDFGRDVLTESPDSGSTWKRYDAADRLVQTRDANGILTVSSYDPAGRIILRNVKRSSDSADASTTRYVYQGRHLIELSNPQQTERYTYDEMDRLTARAVQLKLVGGSSPSGTATYEERYRYDAWGRLAARSLPDGGELQYERNGQGQVVAVTRQATAWAPFGWGRTTIAGGLERDLVGLRSLTYGNGVVGQWQRSREGVLARVVYTSPLQTRGAWRIAFERLIGEARAQAPDANAVAAAGAGDRSGAAPGAFGMISAPRALSDSRLLYDLAGNVVVHGQFADTVVAKPGQTAYLYDGLNQLAQATRVDSVATAETDVPVVDRRDEPGAATLWRYHHDSLGNRLLAQQPQANGQVDATLKTSYEGSVSDRPRGLATDAAGRPAAAFDRQLTWDEEGRLDEASQAGRPTARYRYDARGLRVSKQIGNEGSYFLYDERRQRSAELDSQGRVTREYVWLGDRLIAVLDMGAPRIAAASAGGVLERLGALVGAAWGQLQGHGDSIAYVHTNHLGAPIAMTDERALPVWGDDLSPFGQHLAVRQPAGLKVSLPSPAAVDRKHLRLDLRLPGQWEDEETGLHYNDQRYYDPVAGRYLSPDPSGLRGGLNGYAYVQNNPIGFADPLGLVLFAFDGTGNTKDTTWLAAHDSSLSNVFNFRKSYNDGNKLYMAGVGTVQQDLIYGDIRPGDFVPSPLKPFGETVDMGGNYSGFARTQRMVQYFNDEADLDSDDDAAMEVDIVGFSRGAAEARDFANLIVAQTNDGYYGYKSANGQQHCQKVDFRFMGLFDTVLSTDFSGHHYNLSIPTQFAYVAQAVALNEFRKDLTHNWWSGFGSFPLESISDSAAGPTSQLGKTRIERGFIGSHADIGGGFGENESDLSRVALSWMVDQAKSAGVRMDTAPANIIANPVIHDKSDSIATGAPRPRAEDREIHYMNGTTATQRKMTFSSGMTYADTTDFIDYFPVKDPRRNGLFQTGTVDMEGYLRWLDENDYGIELQIP